MAGGNHPNGSSNGPSSSNRKSRWESGNKNKQPSNKSPASAAPADSQKPQAKRASKPNENKSTPKSDPSPSSSLPKQSAGSIPHSRPAPTPPAAPLPILGGERLPPQPTYGLHMLDQRTIVLADGSVKSYFALPPDYQDFVHPLRRGMLPPGPETAGPGLGFDNRFPPLGPMSPDFRDREDPSMRGRNQDYWNSLDLDGRRGGPLPLHPEESLKRKYGDEGERGRRDERELKDGKDEFARIRQQLSQYGGTSANDPNGYPVGFGDRGEVRAGTSNPYSKDLADELRASKYMKSGGGFENPHGRHVILKHDEVDQSALKKAFLHYVKLLFENPSRKKHYLENGKHGQLHCLACRSTGRSSNAFPDMHGLIMHTYNSGTDLIVDHLGLHKALCTLKGWSYLTPPDDSKAYQSLSADDASANQEDLIVWPPVVIIHNTSTGKRNGRVEGLGNKAMDIILKDLGFGSGKAKSLYGNNGHLGITLVKFASDETGLREAARLEELLEREKHGRKSWIHVESSLKKAGGGDDDKNPNLVQVNKKTGEKERILYGHLGTVCDLDLLDFETRKKAAIESKREYRSSSSSSSK